MHRGDPRLILTLTMRQGRYPTPEAQAVALSHAWRRLRRAAMRHYKLEKLPFMAVFERHKSGWPHLHILIRAKWLDQQWLSDWMASEEDSPVVDISRVRSRTEAANYVTKAVGYASKNPERFQGVKRYWRSKDYILRPREHSGRAWDEIYIVNRSWYGVVDDAIRTGYAVSVQGDRAIYYWAIHGPPPADL